MFSQSKSYFRLPLCDSQFYRTLLDKSCQIYLVRSRESVALDITHMCSLRLLDTRDVYHLHLKQLATQLPLVAACLVFRSPNSETRQVVTYCDRDPSDLGMDAIAVEVETWRDQVISILQATELKLAVPYRVYVCWLSLRPLDCEYLLICCDEWLSDQQKWTIEQQARVLRQSLLLHEEYSRQETRIQILEQVIQRVEHQLRNPLSLISLHADLLHLQLPEGTLRQEVETIQETVKDLSLNLKNLLYCGSQAGLNITSCDLRKLFQESVAQLQNAIAEKQLEIHCSTSPAMLTVDGWQIRQVFDNLLSNAIHFSPPGSTISCHWQVFHSEILIELSDQGSGLSATDLTQAFVPFYSQRPGGTGLGLAIAQKIILDHQGSLWANNLPQGGAQFSIVLPRLRS
jgi:signal transduction histidine kinase